MIKRYSVPNLFIKEAIDDTSYISLIDHWLENQKEEYPDIYSYEDEV